jgi:hypothetical protein
MPTKTTIYSGHLSEVHTHKKINATKILRAAMILADKAPIDKLLRAIVEGEAKGVL